MFTDRVREGEAPDGVTLRLGHDPRGSEEAPNFLPVSDEDFYLALRMYGGDEAVQAGRYPVPRVTKI